MSSNIRTCMLVFCGIILLFPDASAKDPKPKKDERHDHKCAPGDHLCGNTHPFCWIFGCNCKRSTPNQVCCDGYKYDPSAKRCRQVIQRVRHRSDDSAEWCEPHKALCGKSYPFCRIFGNCLCSRNSSTQVCCNGYRYDPQFKKCRKLVPKGRK